MEIMLDNYLVKETKSAYYISSIWDENYVTQIRKSQVEKLETNEEPMMLATFLKIIEDIRMFGFYELGKRRQAPRKITNKAYFSEALRRKLRYLSLEGIIEIVSDMKYDDIVKFFFGNKLEWLKIIWGKDYDNFNALILTTGKNIKFEKGMRVNSFSYSGNLSKNEEKEIISAMMLMVI